MRTPAGTDWQARVMGANSGAGIGTGDFSPAHYLAVTENGDPPSAGVLEGEPIEGTLKRAMGVFTHTSGASSYTLSRTFTADRPFAPRKIGVFHLAEGGEPNYVTVVDQSISVVEGEMFTVTETVTF